LINQSNKKSRNYLKNQSRKRERISETKTRWNWKLKEKLSRSRRMREIFVQQEMKAPKGFKMRINEFILDQINTITLCAI
jgi:tRNA uridine 5-carbamoylmethylation protein Kti12